MATGTPFITALTSGLTLSSGRSNAALVIFQLKKRDETKSGEDMMWRQAADVIAKNIPKGRKDILVGESFVLLSGGSAFHFLVPIVTAAVNCKVPYKIVFIEKASEWEYVPDKSDLVPTVA